MTMKPLASLSLDADNQWSYMKIHGDDGWESFPSYLDVLAPRALDLLARHGLRITFFVVGQDAALPENRDALGAPRRRRPRDRQPLVPPRALAAPLLGGRARRGARPGRGRRSRPRPASTRRASAARATASPRRRCGSCVRRGYAYDASTLPTYIGPLARAYYFRTAELTAEQRDRARAALRHVVRRPPRGAAVPLGSSTTARCSSCPVTTLPGLKVPIHVSYLLMLSAYSPAAARRYFDTALRVVPRDRRRAVDPAAPARPPLRRRREGARVLPRHAASRSTEKLARVDSYLDLLAAPLRRRPGGRARRRARRAGAAGARPRLRRAELGAMTGAGAGGADPRSPSRSCR